MAGTSPRLPEQFRNGARDDDHVVDFTVSELVSDAAGSHSPFGDLEFPVPVDALMYQHPRPEDRPRLPEGR
jgi:hypothetical protein